MDYIKIDNDRWDDHNKVWAVLEYQARPNSTGVHLVLEDTVTGEVHSRVVASNQIEWIEAKDW
jgi:hypothetical protein